MEHQNDSRENNETVLQDYDFISACEENVYDVTDCSIPLAQTLAFLIADENLSMIKFRESRVPKKRKSDNRYIMPIVSFAEVIYDFRFPFSVHNLQLMIDGQCFDLTKPGEDVRSYVFENPYPIASI